MKVCYFLMSLTAALGLCHCQRTFSRCREQGATPPGGMGFSSLWLLLWSIGSRCAPGLRRCGSRPSCPTARGTARTRDRTCVPCIGRQILNHWTTREVQLPVFYYTHFNNEKIKPHSTNLCMIAPIKWQKWNVMSCVSGYNNKLPETG